MPAILMYVCFQFVCTWHFSIVSLAHAVYSCAFSSCRQPCLVLLKLSVLASHVVRLRPVFYLFYRDPESSNSLQLKVSDIIESVWELLFWATPIHRATG